MNCVIDKKVAKLIAIIESVLLLIIQGITVYFHVWNIIKAAIFIVIIAGYCSYLIIALRRNRAEIRLVPSRKEFVNPEEIFWRGILINLFILILVVLYILFASIDV